MHFCGKCSGSQRTPDERWVATVAALTLALTSCAGAAVSMAVKPPTRSRPRATCP